MQQRIQSTTSLVVGRLVRAATVQQSDKKALTTYVSTPLRKCKLRDRLGKAGSQESPEHFAEHFDEMYRHRCGERCFSAVCSTIGF